MATVNKDFKIKSGLIVEGTTGTINGFDILTKKTADQNYIIGLIGGAATPENTPDTVVLRDEDGSFSAEVITADGGFVGNVTGTVSDISNHNTDSLTEGSNNLYFSESRAQTGVSNALGSGLGYGSEGAGNVFYVDTNVIATKEFATDEANAAQAAAEQTAANDATTKANNAQSAAEQTAAADATTKADNALAAAEDYADAKINDASSDSDKSWSAYKTSTEIGLAEDRAKQHADDAVADLVGSAPELLDTLQELATALDNNPDIIADLQDVAAGKQDTLTAGNGIAIDGTTIGVAFDAGNGLAINGTNLTIDTNVIATKAYAEQAETDAVSSANSYTDGEITDALTTAQGYATTAYDNAVSHADGLDSATNTRIDDLTTDDVAEGTAQYFTDGRAKTSAADLLTGASLTNITITGTGAGLTITAENGVADSTTDDLEEGEDNLYFTDQRVIDAVDNAVINPQAVEINMIARQVASTLEAATAGIQVGHTFAKADYRSAEFLVKVAYGSHTEISKVLLTLDTSDNIAITEYGIVGTNGSASTISADISGTDVRLLVTTANNNSTVTVMGTLLV